MWPGRGYPPSAAGWPRSARPAAGPAVLRKAYQACRPGGRVLIMERLFDDDRRGPLATAVMNLEMHVETQGRHRTAAEYTDLLAEAGFDTAAVRRSSREKHLVTGHKGATGLSNDAHQGRAAGR